MAQTFCGTETGVRPRRLPEVGEQFPDDQDVGGPGGTRRGPHRQVHREYQGAAASPYREE